MNLKELKVAENWQSYRDLMDCILNAFQPRTVIEFGSGESTRTLSNYPSVDCLVTVEHNEKYFNKIPLRTNIIPYFKDYEDAYREVLLKKDWYDLVFIDGKERQRLLEMAHTRTNLVLLHDASRGEYREFIEPYKYKFANDSKCTLALTDDEETYNLLKEAYENRHTPAEFSTTV